MVTIEMVINSTPSGMTLYPAGMHCPTRDDAFGFYLCFMLSSLVVHTLQKLGFIFVPRL